jgi:hypothetical protein
LTSQAPEDAAAVASRRQSVLRRFWRVLLPVASAAFAALALSGWLALHAFEARTQLAEARRELLTVESALRQGRLQPGDSAVTRGIAAAAHSTEVARRLTSDRLWRLGAAVPIAGCPLRSSAKLTGAADELTRRVVQPLAALVPLMKPHRGPEGFAVDVGGLRTASGGVAAMTGELAALSAEVTKASGCGFAGNGLGIAAGQHELEQRLVGLSATVDDLAKATRLAPAMLGADGPRRYLLVVQNDAQSRATGGIISGFGIISARSGRLSLVIRNDAALPAIGTTPVLRLSPDLQDRYGRLRMATAWGNANLSPDYPAAARVFSAMWARGTGQQLDGVVAMDPSMLGYLLSEVGTARLPDGHQVTGDGLADLLQSRIYSMFPTAEQRDVYFSAVGASIYSSLLTSGVSPARLLSAMGRAADEGRLLIWSRRAGEQQMLSPTPLGGVLPTDTGPFLAVVSQNGTGSKLDYWLRRSTEYQLRRLPNGSGEAVVTVRFRNTAPSSGLPLYVRQRLEEGAPRHFPPGQTALYVSIYGGIGGGFISASLDGRAVQLESETEKGHGVFSIFVTMDPGQTATLRVVLSEPLWRPYVVLRRQPLVSPEQITVNGAKVRPVYASVP